MVIQPMCVYSQYAPSQCACRAGGRDSLDGAGKGKVGNGEGGGEGERMGRGRLKREALHAEASADKRLLQVTDSPQDAPAPTDTPRPPQLHRGATSHSEARSVHPRPRQVSAPRQKLSPLGGARLGKALRKQRFRIATLELKRIPAARGSCSAAIPGKRVAPTQEPCQRRVLVPADLYAQVRAPTWLWRRCCRCAPSPLVSPQCCCWRQHGGCGCFGWRGWRGCSWCCHCPLARRLCCEHLAVAPHPHGAATAAARVCQSLWHTLTIPCPVLRRATIKTSACQHPPLALQHEGL